MALIVFGLAKPHVIGAQLGARPASVALTVVVPPRSPSSLAVTSEGSVSFIRRTPTAIDFETTVGVMDRPATRLEVRLGAGWGAESTGVWVQNSRGEFERLLRESGVVAIDATPSTIGSTAALRFRMESTPPRLASPMAIPLEYRLTVGRDDEFSIWSFSSLLKVGAGR